VTSASELIEAFLTPQPGDYARDYDIELRMR
jgi:hypothetical protein